MIQPRILPVLIAIAAWHGVATASPAGVAMVPVGDTLNPPDPATGFGRVRHAFQIGKYDVSIDDYVAFLNAVAKADPHGLYNPAMASDLMVASIIRAGAPGSYLYRAIEPSGAFQSSAATAGGRPITYVSWFDAARYANWVSNGRPNGQQTRRTTENGAYNLTGHEEAEGVAVARNHINPNTKQKPVFYIPGEDEWYKAAYYNPGPSDGSNSYTLYATHSSTAPGNSAGSSPNQSNYVAQGLFAMTQQLSLDLTQNYLTDVGAFTGTPGPYGTYDMNGSVWELTDMDGSASVIRTIRGGGWTSYYSYLQSDYRLGNSTTAASSNVGFRLAASGDHASSVGYQLLPVADRGNKPDRTGYGSVAKPYWIGKFEVTIQQYCDFLNAVAATDSYGLYDPAMSNVLNSAGIVRSGSSGSYSYAPMANAGDSAHRPITYINWFDAARFANWMANGQPTGPQGPATTENGAYNLSGKVEGRAVPRNRVNPNRGGHPTFYIPTENQWYKAAYYSPHLNHHKGGYYRYATASNTPPGNLAGNSANMANYIDDYSGSYFYSVTQERYIDPGQNYLFDTGAYTGSASYYGTYDQSGGVYNWNDLDGSASTSRGIRGGFYFAGTASIQSVTFAHVSPAREGADTGFRLAGPAAEYGPCSSSADEPHQGCSSTFMKGTRPVQK